MARGKFIIVVGVGRSGTSNTARVLHKRLGVCMGHKFIKPHSKFQPDGTYEDANMHDWSNRLVNDNVSTGEWLEKFHEEHTCPKKTHRGIKMNNFASLSPDQMESLDPYWLVWADRPLFPNVFSLVKCRGGSIEAHIKFYFKRQESLQKLSRVVPTIKICYDRKVEDDDIVEMFRGKLP